MARKALIKILFLFACLALASCASTSGARGVGVSKDYVKLVDGLTVEDELYAGWSNVFHYSATLVTESLYEAQIDQISKAKQYSEKEIARERRKMAESVANETKVFLSFYTPEVQYNDLNESGSVWRIFLDVDGKRYTAKIMKESKNFADTKNLYPKHTPWGRIYSLKFPVSYLDIKDSKRAKIVITGSLGISSKEFVF